MKNYSEYLKKMPKQSVHSFSKQETSIIPFTFDYFKNFLNYALESNYSISSFEKYNKESQKTIILRHDIDYTLNGVLDIAHLENKAGVSATYFFRVHAHEYNLFNPHVYNLLLTLQNLGHEIGLHFEACSFAHALSLKGSEVLKKEKNLLEMILEKKVLSASEHRDISHNIYCFPWLHESINIYDFGFLYYAMDEQFTKKMKYISDSNGIWREGDPLKHVNIHDKLQILIHPDWWFSNHLMLKGPYFHGLGNGDV